MFGKFTKVDDGAVAIQLVTADKDLENRLREIFTQDERFDFESAFETVGTLESQGLTSRHPSLLLVEIDQERSGELEALERVIESAGPGRPIIAIVDSFSESTVRKLLQLHVTDLISKSGSQADLFKACERAIRPEGPSTRFGGAKCYAFISAGGGAGNTSLAIQSAFVSARKTHQFQSTCIIDMDFQGGAVTDYLDVTPNLQLDELSPSPERLDVQLLEVMVSRHDSGLAILAADHALRSYETISTELVTRMLDMASAKFETVVLDMPRVWLPWTESVLRGSDRVFIVTEMTVPGLRQARRLSNAIMQRCGDDIDVSVIVNRFRKTMFGGVNSVRQKDAEDVLGGRIAGFVAQDYPLVREAIDRGLPLYEVKKGNRIDKDLETILFDAKPTNLPAPVKRLMPRIELSAAKI